MVACWYNVHNVTRWNEKFQQIKVLREREKKTHEEQKQKIKNETHTGQKKVCVYPMAMLPIFARMEAMSVFT